MDLGLNGKTALITASSSGLGKSIASCLAREGARVILNSRKEEALIETSKALPNPEKHTYYTSDLTRVGESENLVNFLIKEDLIPDIVVHNLGGNLGITDPLCSLEEWNEVQRVNVEIPIEINRLLIPFMQKKNWGRICHVSSISALENQGPPSYCAAKAALVAYTRSLGRYVAKDGVIINAILPGAVMTERGYWADASRDRPDHVKKYLEERMAIGRFGSPDEIGNVVAFLCSDLSSFCVGSSFLVDGGQGKVFFS